MKKKIFLFLLILLFVLIGSTNVFACEDVCKIRNGPADSLDKYLTNLKKVVSNVAYVIGNNEVKKTSEEKKGGLVQDTSSIKEKVLGIFNKMINWGGYYTNFDFYIMYSLKHEYVQEVWRDYNLLEQQSQSLDKFFKYATRKGAGLTITKDEACKGIEVSCDYEGDILDVLGKIIDDHENFKTYYKLSILGKKSEANFKLQLVDENFESNFSENYNENTSTSCSKCAGGGLERIGDEIEKISNWQENAKKGFQSWKDAVDLMLGNYNSSKQVEIERKILEKELARNGTSANASENILKNLNKYNESGGFSFDNNFITNSFDYLSNSIGNQFNEFTQSVTDVFEKNAQRGSIQSVQVAKEYNVNIDKNDIENVIDYLYKSELDLAQMQDISNENLQGRIINLHFNIVKGIENMNKTQEISQKVCGSQAANRGDCDPTK